MQNFVLIMLNQHLTWALNLLNPCFKLFRYLFYVYVLPLTRTLNQQHHIQHKRRNASNSDELPGRRSTAHNAPGHWDDESSCEMYSLSMLVGRKDHSYLSTIHNHQISHSTGNHLTII